VLSGISPGCTSRSNLYDTATPWTYMNSCNSRLSNVCLHFRREIRQRGLLLRFAISNNVPGPLEILSTICASKIALLSFMLDGLILFLRPWVNGLSKATSKTLRWPGMGIPFTLRLFFCLELWALLGCQGLGSHLELSSRLALCVDMVNRLSCRLRI
jgi:hypothetical protein